MGFATMFNKILTKLVTWDADNEMDTCNDNSRHEVSPGYTIELNKLINSIRCPPDLTDGNELKPMKKMPMSNLSRGKEIGFIVDTNELLPVKQQDFYVAKLFQDYSFATEGRGEFPYYHPPLHGSRHKDMNLDTPLLDFCRRSLRVPRNRSQLI